MIYLRRIFMVSAAIVAIHMQGCGCDDDKKYYPPPQDNSYTVNGTAGKGILSGFQVEAYRFSAGIIDPAPISSAITSAIGHYSLDIPNIYINQPLVLRLTPGPLSPFMICDLSTGCGPGVNFGQDLPITDPSFELETVVPSTSDNSVANITLLTTLAAQLAQEAIESGSTSEEIQAAINEANSSVANRFGLTGDLTTIPVIDLTDPAAVRAAMEAGDSNLVQYAALNSAIVQAARMDNNLLSFIGALNAFITYFADQGVAGNTSDAAETSLADILAAARAVLMQVQANDPEAPQGLAALLQSLFVDQQLAESEPADGYSQGTPSSTSGATPLAKVKAMVSDLKNLAISFGETSLDGGGTIGGISEDFAMQLEAAEMASSEHAGYLIEAMAIAAAAIDDANRAHSNNSQLTTYASDTGVNVTIATEDDTSVFSVDQNIQVEADSGMVTIAVELDATDSLTYGETDSSEMSADGEYEVIGSAASSSLSMSVKEGSSISIEDLAVVETENSQPSEISENQSVDALNLNLMIELSQEEVGDVTDPVTLEGTLVASLSNVMIVDTESGTTESSTKSLGMVSLKLSGVVSNTSGESASFAVSVSGDGTGVSFVDSWTQQGETSTGETTSNFVDMYGSVAFTAELTGNPNVVSMNYSVARTGLEDADNSLTIRYPGKQFRFKMLVADGAPEGNLTITNHDGVIMSLIETMVEGESRLQGTISLNGVQYGTVEEDNTVIFRFIDDSFESL